jgi:hypothetical protein
LAVVYIATLKVTAAATRAETAAQILLSTMTTPAPLDEPELGVAAAFAPPVVALEGEALAGGGFAGGVTTATDVVATADDVALAGAVVFPTAAGGAPAGGGLASAGLTRAPVPHGIASPVPGCVASVGGVDAPDASASVNRVVHKVTLEAGLVNW